MSDLFLKPRASYEAAVRDRAGIASREASMLFNQLQRHKGDLDDHGYTPEQMGTMVAVKRGSLDVVRVVFNYGDSGRHLVTNGVSEALRQGLAVDFDDPAVARSEFLNQLRHATDLFYANKLQFEALGLA